MKLSEYDESNDYGFYDDFKSLNHDESGDYDLEETIAHNASRNGVEQFYDESGDYDLEEIGFSQNGTGAPVTGCFHERARQFRDGRGDYDLEKPEFSQATAVADAAKSFHDKGRDNDLERDAQQTKNENEIFASLYSKIDKKKSIQKTQETINKP